MAKTYRFVYRILKKFLTTDLSRDLYICNANIDSGGNISPVVGWRTAGDFLQLNIDEANECYYTEDNDVINKFGHYIICAKTHEATPTAPTHSNWEEYYKDCIEWNAKIADKFSSVDSNIEGNASNISNNSTNIGTNTTNISNNSTNINTNSTNITNLNSAIEGTGTDQGAKKIGFDRTGYESVFGPGTDTTHKALIALANLQAGYGNVESLSVTLKGRDTSDGIVLKWLPSNPGRFNYRVEWLWTNIHDDYDPDATGNSWDGADFTESILYTASYNIDIIKGAQHTTSSKVYARVKTWNNTTPESEAVLSNTIEVTHTLIRDVTVTELMDGAAERFATRWKFSLPDGTPLLITPINPYQQAQEAGGEA